MKKIILALVVVATTLTINAQGTFKFGIAGGANLADISLERETTLLPGFHAGLKFEIKLPVKLGIELGALYSVKGASYEQTNILPVGTSTEQVDIVLSYVDLPLVAKIYTFKVLSFQLGPQVSYLISAKNDGVDIMDDLNSTDFGAVIGLGLDVSKLHMAVRYNLGLTEISENSGKNNVIQATLGFWIK